MEVAKRERKRQLPGKRRKLIIKIIVLLVIIAAAGFGVMKFAGNKKSAKPEEMAPTTPVTRGDVEVTISGSGTVEPNARYEIIPLVSGEIISCPYEVGDYIQEGAVVYTFDKEDAELNLRKQQNSMESSTISYNKTKSEATKLNVTSPAAGVIKDLTVKVGDEVNANQQIASIYNDRIMEVDIPFNKEQLTNIYVGADATLSNSSMMSTFNGKVTHIDSTSTAQANGSAMYYVTIEFENPGAVVKDAQLGASVNGQISSGYGNARYSYEGVIKTEIAGTVSKLPYKNGDYINGGVTVVKLKSEDLENTLRSNEISYSNAKISLEEQMSALDNYSITAPISGTVITKNSKAGDTIDRSNSSVTMMVIADISKLKFTLAIDELDVGKVSTGQTVKVTADAVEGEVFEGYISEMSMEGASSNGVTTYNATVTIDNPGKLRPSMNVDAVIIIESVQNVLRVSTNDIKTARGKSYVFVKDNGENENASPEQRPAGQRPEGGQMPAGQRPEGGQMPQGQRPEGGQMPQGQRPEGGQVPPGQNAGGAGGRQMMPQAPEGFKTVEIEIGVSGDDFTEVKSGLNEGDLVYQQAVSSGGNMFGMRGGMPGGMGGRMPGGMSARPGGMGGMR